MSAADSREDSTNRPSSRHGNGSAGEGVVLDLRERVVGSVRQSDLVPFVDLLADYHAFREEIDDAMSDVLRRCDFILGEATDQFEQEFAEYCGVGYAIGVDSGFSAIELILRAFEIGPGDEVITAANTFYSTVRPIEACGAKPVLVDVDPQLRNIDPDLIEPAVTDSTRAIIAVHLYGHPADMSAINSIARANGLHVFEDACQAHGARYWGERVGSLADAAAFSFYPAKNLGCFGDGGMVVTDRQDIDGRVRRLRNLGSKVKYQHEGDGFNRRLDTIQAAVLRVKLRHLDHANATRRRLAGLYAELLGDVQIGVPETAEWAEPVYHLYPIEVANREALIADLDDKAIQTGIHYPVPVYLQPAFRSLGHRIGDFPVTDALAGRILSLPMHPFLSSTDVTFVADSIRSSVAVLAGTA